MRNLLGTTGLRSPRRGTSLRPTHRKQTAKPHVEQLEVRTLLAAGDLDPQFGSAGVRITEFDNESAIAFDVAIQPDDDKIVVVGLAGNGSQDTQDFAIARYNPDGNLDPTFDADGQLRTDFNSLNDKAKALAIQDDGKIVVVGTVHVVGSQVDQLAVVRYNSDGSLDASFATGGKFVTTFFGQANDVAIQDDGKIVVVGKGFLPFTGQDFLVARFLTDGTLDPTFNSGLVLTNIPLFASSGVDTAEGVAIQDDGKIVVVGSTQSYDFSIAHFAAARYLPDGSLDPNFGVGGIVTTAFSSHDEARAVAIQADDRIVVAGTTDVAFALARYLEDGTLDPDFDDDGKVTSSFPGYGHSGATDLAIQKNGRIVAVGSASQPGTGSGFALARYQADGSLDPSLGGDGRVITEQVGSQGLTAAHGVAIQSDGKIVAAGEGQILMLGHPPGVALARYKASSLLDVFQQVHVLAINGGPIDDDVTITDHGAGLVSILSRSGDFEGQYSNIEEIVIDTAGGADSVIYRANEGIRSSIRRLAITLGAGADLADVIIAAPEDANDAPALEILGGDGDDTLRLNHTLARAEDSGTRQLPPSWRLDGQEDSDVYEIRFRRFGPPVVAADSGARGTDRLGVNAADLFDVRTTDSAVLGDGTGDGTFDRTLEFRGMEAIDVDAGGPQIRTLRRLENDSLRAPTVELVGGIPRFVDARVLIPAELPDDPVVRALDFLGRYRDMYRLTDPAAQLFLNRLRTDRFGEQHLRFGQQFGGIPVFGAQIVLHLAGHLVRGTAGNYLPEPPASGDPMVLPLEAEATALGMAPGADPRVVGSAKLTYYNPSLLGNEDTDTHLAWDITIRALGESSTYLVDAQNGALLAKFTHSPDHGADKDFDIQTANNTSSNSCWDAPGVTADDDWFDEDGSVGYPGAGSDPFLDGQDAFNLSHQVYNWFFNKFHRHSYDGDEEEIEVMVHVQPLPGIAGYEAGCDHFLFGNGAVVLDVYAHEFTHGIDENEAKLIYMNQSGALDESYADVFAALIDSADWLIGEDLPGGATRDISNPPAFGDPDHFSEFLITTSDSGGVHTNSGIMNKAAFLIAAGGTHPDSLITVFGIGRDKLAQLYYNVLTTWLAQSSSFMDARNATVAQATWMADPANPFKSFTTHDVCQVINAFAAVGLGTPDLDCDGLANSVDPDNDGDGVLDGPDNCNNIPNPTQLNTDGDLLGNACDGDDDNDGVPDATDNCSQDFNPSQADFNGDGDGDACSDSDGDFIKDSIDKCPTKKSTGNLDNDGDGLGDPCDPDDDNDGILDDGGGNGFDGDQPCPDGVTENCDDNAPKDYNPGQEDSDGDLVGDAGDNCVNVPNPDQTDGDHDGAGNACDPDDDNDGVLDREDNCKIYNPDQQDLNGNGLGDVCDQAFKNFLLSQVVLIKYYNKLPIRIPIDPCYSCPDYIPENYVTQVTAKLPFDMPAAIVDDRGFVVAKSKAGVLKSMTFHPAADFHYLAPIGNTFGAALSTRQAETSASPAQTNALSTMQGLAAITAEPIVYRGRSYFLELYPTDEIMLGQVYVAELQVFSTLVNDRASSISGRIVEDFNGDGVKDHGEPGVPGQKVELVSGNNEQVVATTFTDADGYYAFRNLPHGAYTVEVQHGSEWRYVPVKRFALLLEKLIYDGVDFTVFNSGDIMGQKIHDHNGNGRLDAGDEGLDGWTIRLHGTDGLGNAVVKQTVTQSIDLNRNGEFESNEHGLWQLTGVAPGSYVVEEVAQQGWVTTAPATEVFEFSGTITRLFISPTVPVPAPWDDVSVGDRWSLRYAMNPAAVDLESVTPVVGLNSPLSSYTLAVGSATESAVLPAGSSIFVANNRFTDPRDEYVAQYVLTKTVGGGQVWLTDHDAVEFSSDAQPKCTQLQLADFEDRDFTLLPFNSVHLIMGTVDELKCSNDGHHRLAVQSGGKHMLDFVNTQPVPLNGVVFHDQDADGRQTAFEAGLRGWEVELVDVTASRVVARTTTDAAGKYTFDSVMPGTYHVQLVPQPGWENTPGPPIGTVVTSGDALPSLFSGIFQPAGIAGLKFHDSNGNGVKDANEPGLRGWIITLDQAADGTVEATATTGEDGSYRFAGLVPDTYRVRERPETGWVQTTAEPIDLGLRSGTVANRVDFGNFHLVQLSGQKFFDANANGRRDSTEPGLPGWVVQLDHNADGTNDRSAVTDTTGFYTFDNVSPGTHRLTEQPQAGFRQTFPGGTGEHRVQTTSGQNRTGLDFGNFASQVRFSRTAISISESTSQATITVSLSPASSVPVSVEFATLDGSATAGSDFTPTSGQLTFAPGQTTKSFTVGIINDRLDEATETVRLALSNARAAVLGSPATAVLSILDNDLPPTVRFRSNLTSAFESAGQATIDVLLSEPSGLPVSVAYATRNGTAIAGTDYTRTSGRLMFTPGQTLQSFVVPIANDSVRELDETVFLSITSPSNATLSTPSTATLTIRDGGPAAGAITASTRKRRLDRTVSSDSHLVLPTQRHSSPTDLAQPRFSLANRVAAIDTVLESKWSFDPI